jgi:hypothetical protein
MMVLDFLMRDIVKVQLSSPVLGIIAGLISVSASSSYLHCTYLYGFKNRPILGSEDGKDLP